MAQAAFKTEDKIQPNLISPRIRATLTSIVTFLAVCAVLLLVWEGVKAAFHLNQGKLPHVGSVINALFTPIQEGRPPLIVPLLTASLFTLRGAAMGFALGAGVGFALAVIFAHSRLLERGLMPFVVASQTVPILAVAPIVVVWLKAGWISVAVIAAYLTFFPVTINTLRGLVSVPPTALELMQTFAATRWEILIKLRIPNALPYIFTALKISATASVVGAIIGELPSGIPEGLGYQILTFNQYYLTGPERLWATNLMAALVGIFAFGLVSLAERLLVRWIPPAAKSS